MKPIGRDSNHYRRKLTVMMNDFSYQSNCCINSNASSAETTGIRVTNDDATKRSDDDDGRTRTNVGDIAALQAKRSGEAKSTTET